MAQQGLRDMIKALSPEWLQEGVGEKLLYAMGAAMDSLVEKLNQGMRLHMPGYGDPTGLPYIGQDRLIPQGYQETNTAYAARLKLAWDSWLHAGSAVAILNQVLGFVSPATPIVQLVSNSSVWDTINALGQWTHYAAPANWNWDYQTTAWWRSWVIMQSTPWSAEGTWGDGQVYGDGGAWGTTATPAQCQSLRSIVALWKPAHNTIVNIIISYDATLFDQTLAFGSSKLPDGHHHVYKSVAGVVTPTRFSAAAYLDSVT